MTPDQPNAATVIGILDGEDPVVDTLLESLLISAGYGVRSFVGDEPEESLAECVLLLFAPGLSLAHRRDFLGGAGYDSRIPVLELVKSIEGTVGVRAAGDRIPSLRMEELKQEIEAALLSATGMKSFPERSAPPEREESQG